MNVRVDDGLVVATMTAAEARRLARDIAFAGLSQQTDALIWCADEIEGKHPL